MVAEIVSQWTFGDFGLEPEVISAIGAIQPLGWQFNDVTEQQTVPGNPNSVVVACYNLEQSTLDAIAADNRFYILWSSE